MADSRPATERPDLELEVGSGVEVELRHLVSASSTFSGLINEVAEAYTGVSRPVKWFVDVEPGSVRLPLRATPGADGVHAAAAHEVSTVIVDGLAHLEREPTRPPYFTDKALEQSKALANLLTDDLPLAVRNGAGRLPLTKQLLVNAEKALGMPREGIGTVEGRLEALNVHEAKEFAVWSADGQRVKCLFGRHLTLEDVLPAVGKRVAARGRIKTRPSGDRISVEVHELRIIGADPVLADEVLGIFEGREVADG